MPRILILSAEFPPGPGGIGTHAYQVATGLGARGWRVSVASMQEYVTRAEVEAFNRTLPFPMQHLRQPPGAAGKLAYRAGVLARLVARERPDLVLASGERMVWVASLVAPMLRAPYVAIGHAQEFNVPARWQRAINRRTFQRAAAVICVSRYTEDRMRAMGVAPRRAIVIPNGADETRFVPASATDGAAFRRAHGLERATMLVTVGSVHERKGQDVVIRALPRIRARIPDVHFVSIGSPFRAEAFTNLARELGVADRVHFLGARPQHEIVQALSAADLFVMTSQHTPNGDFEGYGIAVVEAALCGRAAVVSDNSGVMEAIEPGETGLVAHISSPISTAERIIELAGDPARLARMGALARQRALDGKTWRHRCAEYDRFLRALLLSG